MNSNINKIIIFSFVLVITMSVLYATDSNNTDTITQTSTNTYESSQTNTENSHLSTIPLEQESKEIKKSEEDNLIININDNNYHDYFNVYGEVNFTKLKNNTTLNFYSIPKNTEEISFITDDDTSNMNLTIIGQENFTMKNTAFIISSSLKKLQLCNITLNYTEDYDYNEHLTINSLNYNNENFILENITVNCVQNPIGGYNDYYTRAIHPIRVTGNNIILKNIQVFAKLPSNTISWYGEDNKPHSIGLYSEGNNIIINNSQFYIEEKCKENEYAGFNTIYAVYLSGENLTFTNNTIQINGTEYVYALTIQGNGTKISNNNITSKSITYSAGINLGGIAAHDNMINNNTINITAGYREQGTTPNGAEDSAYAALLTDYSYKGGKYTPNTYSITNNSYINNTITGSAGNIYGIEMFGGTNTNLSNNNIQLTGRTPMGIGTIGENVTITANNITCTGQTNNTEGSADYLKPRTTGVYTYLSSAGITVNNNIINTTNGRGIYLELTNNTQVTNNQITTQNYDYTIDIIGQQNTITNNYLISRNHDANNSIQSTGENNIQNNTNTPPIITYENTLQINTTTFTAGQTTTITATIYYKGAINRTINNGKVTFKVNGKTLKDANGKIIYTKVVDGVATATYQVPIDVSGKNLNITAVYSGSNKLDKQTATTTVTVKETTPTLTITPFTEPVTMGSTVTFKTKVAAGDKAITTGKIVFKINGKTVKDANGKVIYAKVDANGEVSVDYTIPESFKAGTYNIEAVFTASGYEKLTDNTTMTVVKS